MPGFKLSTAYELLKPPRFHGGRLDMAQGFDNCPSSRLIGSLAHFMLCTPGFYSVV